MIKQQTVRGEPIKVGGREIIPEARLTWMMQRHATFGLQDSSGYGGAIVTIQPTAVIEQGAGRTRRISIHNQTDQLLWGLLVGALALPLLMELAVRLAKPKST
jgi:uncharacterized spore protein YtfJ